tara:strand:+ start:76 stop:258 length:183 start_codon:yes stop_codon:yes gene_type:complete
MRPSGFYLSARGYHQVLRLARTVADLEGCEKIAKPHIAEALSYRLARGRAAKLDTTARPQ